MVHTSTTTTTTTRQYAQFERQEHSSKKRVTAANHGSGKRGNDLENADRDSTSASSSSSSSSRTTTEQPFQEENTSTGSSTSNSDISQVEKLQHLTSLDTCKSAHHQLCNSDGNVSSTQEESEVSSYVWNVCEPQPQLYQNVPSLSASVSDPVVDDDDKDAETEAQPHSAPLTTVPFLSLNVMRRHDEVDEVSTLDWIEPPHNSLQNVLAPPTLYASHGLVADDNRGLHVATTTPSVWIRHAYVDMLPLSLQIAPNGRCHDDPSNPVLLEAPTAQAHKDREQEERHGGTVAATTPGSRDHGTVLSLPVSPCVAAPPSLSPPAPFSQRSMGHGANGACIPWHIYIPTLTNDANSNNHGLDGAAMDNDCGCGAASVATEHVTLQTEILDPTEPLFYGHDWTEHNHHLLSNELQQAADTMHDLLGQHWQNPSCPHIVQDIVACIQEHPETCQVRYPPMDLGIASSSASSSATTSTAPVPWRRNLGGIGVGAVYPLSYFCVTACLTAVQAAYAAFPEAIGSADACLGLPLHYACHHAPLDTPCLVTRSRHVIEFLVSTFGDAVRRTNDVHQTALHLACSRDRPSPDIVALLVAAYPAAALTFDDQGYTPLLQICRNCHCGDHDWHDGHDLVQILRPLCETSPLTVAAVTGCTMEKALHVAASAGAPLAVIDFLQRHDPSQCRYTDDAFQLPLHKAVHTLCRAILSLFTDPGTAASSSAERNHQQTTLPRLLETVSRLVEAYPGGVHCTDANDERPVDIATRLLKGRELLFTEPQPKNPYFANNEEIDPTAVLEQLLQLLG
jgi:hypothetical protein